MHVLGVIQVQDRLQWALLRQDKVIERQEESLTIPDEVLSIKNLKIVTGLEGSSVLRRDLKLPLTSPRTLKAALPFQLEPLLPFSLDQSVIYPQFHPIGKETFVVVWAATQERIQSHLEKWDSLGIDPDLVSSETLALARWARHVNPDEPELVVVHETLGIAMDHDRVVCAMESPDPARLKLFLKQKYPLFTWVDQATPFAPAIGLALEMFQKHPCQFRQTASKRQKTDENFLMKITAAAGLGLTLITTLLSAGILHFQEARLKQQTGQESVQHFRESIIKETKTSPPVYDMPSTQEVLSWLSTMTAPIEIHHFEYELQTPSNVQISLEFQAQTPSDADLFIKQLQQSPIYELKWISHLQGYKLSFQLRKSC